MFFEMAICQPKRQSHYRLMQAGVSVAIGKHYLIAPFGRLRFISASPSQSHLVIKLHDGIHEVPRH